MMIIQYFLDIDGGWSSWEEIVDTDKKCTNRVRECNNPTKCGGGQYCLGEHID